MAVTVTSIDLRLKDSWYKTIPQINQWDRLNG
jgi:hypothetical protein